MRLEEPLELTRRKFIVAGSSAITLASLAGTPAVASLFEDAVAEFTEGADVVEGALTLVAPEIAENGNNVPVEVTAPGAETIVIFAADNPEPKVIQFNFGPLNPTQFASTRIRLAQTQNVVAIAKMSDGTLHQASAEVKVTIGGCGG